MSSSALIRATQAYLERDAKNYTLDFVPLDIEPHRALSTKAELIGAWRNSAFLVQMFDEGNGWVRLSVNRARMRNDGSWTDGITWEELMAVKRGIGFGAVMAVECYPPDCDVVDVANLRHLWMPKDPAGLAGLGWNEDRR